MYKEILGRMFLRLAVLALCVTSVHAYPSYRDNIPNGYNVANPCDSSKKWDGVGHEKPGGAGTRNPFGEDFKVNNEIWDAAICRKDSDGDGRTNGEELGDPNCVWRKGSAPQVTTGITHPGVCEPIGSSQCVGKNSFVDCQNTGEFVCPAIHNADTVKFEYRFPKTAVPDKETTYMCMNIKLPIEKTYHMIASEPIIDNIDVMHHVVIYGCPGLETAPGPLDKPAECGRMKTQCSEIISLWGAGGRGQCFNENMGFLVGAARSGLKYAIIELHWNNPMLMSTFNDSSGYIFYMTENLRPHNAGVLTIGQAYFLIPPFTDGHVEVGTLPATCSRQLMTGDINVASANNHMHLIGKAQITELIRNGSRVQFLANDDVYEYNSPKTFSFADPVVVHPGDELKTTCVFDSRQRELTTFNGQATQDEMCFAFLTYYPKENMKTTVAASWKSLDACDWSMGPVRKGCNFTQIINPADPETAQIHAMIAAKCSPFVCRHECLAYVKELQKHPCFQGDVYEMFQFSALRVQSNSEYRAKMTYFFAQLDSCDWELWQEGNGHTGDAGGPISVGTSRRLSLSTVIASALIPLSFAIYI
ncbi:MOXD1 homolog 2-like isoform X1 [Dreissena polymorpha]|uniref:MOXD1 homolog 2-like isoform X1 n=1 Tax=Dreissena polymorpha TaxID=45954 RepID=UPI0022652DE7|nr:MOXD1 homolog 2-like isoform X1 [Dreissena polymorpha]